MRFAIWSIDLAIVNFKLPSNTVSNVRTGHHKKEYHTLLFSWFGKTKFLYPWTVILYFLGSCTILFIYCLQYHNFLTRIPDCACRMFGSWVLNEIWITDLPSALRVVQYCRPDSSRFPFPSIGKPEVQMCKGLLMEVIHRTRTDSDGKGPCSIRERLWKS